MRIPPELELCTLEEIVEAVVRHCAKVCEEADNHYERGSSYANCILDEFGLKP